MRWRRPRGARIFISGLLLLRMPARAVHCRASSGERREMACMRRGIALINMAAKYQWLRASIDIVP